MRDDILIGEFSELTGISKRMIRHFDGLGLLAPHRIDRDTGYRFYAMNQVQNATKIRYLQDFGFSLKEIQDLITDQPTAEDLLDILKDQEVKLRNEADLKIGQLLKLKKLIDYVVAHGKGLDEIPLNTAERSLTMDFYQTLKQEMMSLTSTALLQEHIEEHYQQLEGTLVGFINFDIDHFITVNEKFGFEVGDKVIYRFYQLIRDGFADLLKQDVRNRFSRMGGDEFGIFIVNANVEAVEACVKKVIEGTAAHRFSVEGCEMPITASCGLAFSTHISHPHDLIHQSSKALIAAKRNGRNQYMTQV